MHARVCPPRAMNAHTLRTNLLERVFQMVLNAIAVRLALPTRKRRAVVRDDQLEPRRHRASGSVRDPLRLRAVEISLQDELRGDLVDDPA